MNKLVFGIFALSTLPLVHCSAQGDASDQGPATATIAQERTESGAPVSSEAMTQATELTSRYVDTQVTREEGKVIVAFNDSVTGLPHTYSFVEGENAVALQPAAGSLRPNYKTEWHWWGAKFRLNRNETRQLVTEGNNAAVLYAIGAAAGCGACAVGAAIEANWAGQANAFYNRGNCIHLNIPYMTTGETRINTHNCRN